MEAGANLDKVSEEEKGRSHESLCRRQRGLRQRLRALQGKQCVEIMKKESSFRQALTGSECMEELS